MKAILNGNYVEFGFELEKTKEYFDASNVSKNKNEFKSQATHLWFKFYECVEKLFSIFYRMQQS